MYIQQPVAALALDLESPGTVSWHASRSGRVAGRVGAAPQLLLTGRTISNLNACVLCAT